MFSQRTVSSASIFKIKLNIFLDTLIQNFFLKIMTIINFRGDLTDNSSKKEALARMGVMPGLERAVGKAGDV